MSSIAFTSSMQAFILPAVISGGKQVIAETNKTGASVQKMVHSLGSFLDQFDSFLSLYFCVCNDTLLFSNGGASK